MNEDMLQRFLNTNNQRNLTAYFQVRPLLSREGRNRTAVCCMATTRAELLSGAASASAVCIIAFVTCCENKVIASWIKYMATTSAAPKDKTAQSSSELQKDGDENSLPWTSTCLE